MLKLWWDQFRNWKQRITNLALSGEGHDEIALQQHELCEKSCNAVRKKSSGHPVASTFVAPLLRLQILKALQRKKDRDSGFALDLTYSLLFIFLLFQFRTIGKDSIKKWVHSPAQSRFLATQTSINTTPSQDFIHCYIWITFFIFKVDFSRGEGCYIILNMGFLVHWLFVYYIKIMESARADVIMRARSLAESAR